VKAVSKLVISGKPICRLTTDY